MKNRSIYKTLIIIIIVAFVFSVGSTVFALQDDLVNYQNTELMVAEHSLFSLIVIIAGSFVVFGIMVSSVVSELKKRNKK